jgi:hypothetical protein
MEVAMAVAVAEKKDGRARSEAEEVRQGVALGVGVSTLGEVAAQV